MSNYTKADLEATTAKELKRRCVNELGIPGMTKKPKDVVIAAILVSQKTRNSVASVTISKAEPVVEETGPAAINEMNFFAKSRLTKPNERRGNKFSTTCYMACGANDGNFTVVGNTITAALNTFGDILNADIKSTPLVNGEEVNSEYILKEGDVVEFLKPAGQKG